MGDSAASPCSDDDSPDTDGEGETMAELQAIATAEVAAEQDAQTLERVLLPPRGPP